MLGVPVPWSHWVWSESGPEKAHGSRVAVLLGRAGHGVCFGALDLGGAQGPLDLRVEVDLLEEGGSEKYLCLESGSLWGMRCRVVSWLWGPGASASHWVVYVCPPHLPMHRVGLPWLVPSSLH